MTYKKSTAKTNVYNEIREELSVRIGKSLTGSELGKFYDFMEKVNTDVANKMLTPAEAYLEVKNYSSEKISMDDDHPGMSFRDLNSIRSMGMRIITPDLDKIVLAGVD